VLQPPLLIRLERAGGFRITAVTRCRRGECNWALVLRQQRIRGRRSRRGTRNWMCWSERADGGFSCFLAASKHWVAWWQQGKLWEGNRLLPAGVAVEVFRRLERCGPREDVQCSRPDRQARRSQLCLCGRSITQQTSERNSNGPNASERVRRHFQDSYTVAAAEILDKCCGS
jgi:hypothetical protein